MNKKGVRKQNKIYDRIRTIIVSARNKALYAVNTEMVQAYWLIGKEIVEEEQKGERRAGYGERLLENLSRHLTSEFGSGFTIANIKNMRQFYMTYPKRYAVRSELTWTHYRLLMRVEDKQARSFYEIECIDNRWATRELERQIDSLLFERLALSKDKKGVMKLAKKGQEIQKSEDLIKDPYILDFAGLKEVPSLREKDLETALIEHLKEFILELGKGFSFVARQKRIRLGGEDFYIDLVFYNRLLKCFVLIDLKVGKLLHQDIGQIQMYVNYFDENIRKKDENPPIGIILCTDKNEAVVRYTLPKGEKRIFTSKYKLYLPTRQELIAELKKERLLLEQNKRLEGC